MAKPKKDTVKAYRNGAEKEFEKAQWDAMKKSKSTYGWKEKSDLNAEIENKEADIKTDSVNKLQKQLDASVDESTKKDAEIKKLNADVAELQKQLDASATKAEPSKKK